MCGNRNGNRNRDTTRAACDALLASSFHCLPERSLRGEAGEGCLLSIFWVGNKPPEKSIGRQHPSRSLSLSRLCARSLSLALSSHALWGGFAASFFQPPNKVIPVSTRSATCKQFSPRIRLASPSLSASARRMRCSHCCLPFCRYDCTLDAASALFVASSMESVCVGRRVHFQAPNDAVSERARHYVPGYVTLSWHRHRLRHRQRGHNAST